MELIDPTDYKNYILNNYDQVTIFAHYLEIPESDINYCLENKSNKISNPLRVDRDPSLGFMMVQDKQTGAYKLKMYDFADPFYRGDCFDLVGKLLRLSSTRGVEFIAICNSIIYSMRTKKLHTEINKALYKQSKSVFTNIHIEPRLWNKWDIDFWESRGLLFNENKHLIFPLKRSFISNYCDYIYTEDDPGYAWITGYYDNQTLYKLYFPNRDRNHPTLTRFKTNNKYYPLECIHELKPADILVITKGFKEKRLLKRLLFKFNRKYTVEVSNVTAESIIFTDEFALKLYDIFGTVVTNADFDYTGLHSTGVHKRKFGMIRFVPTNGKYGTYDFGGKDLCEIYMNHGELYTLDIIRESYNYLEQQIDLENEKFTPFFSESH